MGEAINLVNNFKVDNVIFNCGEFNDIEKELNNAFETLIELSDQEIQEGKNIIDEIIEYKIQDEEIINHLFDRIIAREYELV